MAEPLCIAILGAESTGKTQLAQTLAPRLAAQTGLRVAWVPETLRTWCDASQRTPQQHEQADVAEEQHRRIAAAASAHDIVLCDTTAMMTAVYSRLVFGDRSLDERAQQLHAGMALSLLMAVDLPWVADGHQRTGAPVRAPVDAALRELLLAQPGPWSVVGGQDERRCENALAALAPLLRRFEAPRGGLFTRWAGGGNGLGQPPGAAPPWRCACCDVPECEQALRQLVAGVARGPSQDESLGPALATQALPIDASSLSDRQVDTPV